MALALEQRHQFFSDRAATDSAVNLKKVTVFEQKQVSLDGLIVNHGHADAFLVLEDIPRSLTTVVEMEDGQFFIATVYLQQLIAEVTCHPATEESELISKVNKVVQLQDMIKTFNAEIVTMACALHPEFTGPLLTSTNISLRFVIEQLVSALHNLDKVVTTWCQLDRRLEELSFADQSELYRGPRTTRSASIAQRLRNELIVLDKQRYQLNEQLFSTILNLAHQSQAQKGFWKYCTKRYRAMMLRLTTAIGLAR